LEQLGSPPVLNWPAPQLAQSADVSLPLAAEYRPGAHWVQTVVPVAAAK
jgi:hypothetical protein